MPKEWCQKTSNFAKWTVELQYGQCSQGYTITLATTAKEISLLGVKPLGNGGFSINLGN